MATLQEKCSTTVAVDLEEDSVPILMKDLKQDIVSSVNWRILVYGLSEHHLSILSGIVGEEIPAENLQASGYSFTKNGVSVQVIFGQNTENKVSHERIDLLIYFIPVVEHRFQDQEEMLKDIKLITADHGKSIWEHSVVILSGMQKFLSSQKQEGIETRFEIFLETLAMHVQNAIEKAQLEKSDTNKVLIRPAGQLETPDLPRPHEKWFSQLWYGCFLSSQIKSMAAVLKIAQDRLDYDVGGKDMQGVPLYKQLISIDKGFLLKPFKDGIKTVAGYGVGMATVGAVIGALATGIPTFGMGAGAGFALGGVVGGTFGVVGGVGRTVEHISLSGKKDNRIESKQKLIYLQMVVNFTKVAHSLKSWASKRNTCKIVVTGMRKEGITTAAKALSSVGSDNLNRTFPVAISSNPKASLEVYDFEGFPKQLAKLESKAKEVIRFQGDKDLLVFCIPITEREDFAFSLHAKALERLLIADSYIFFKTVIALTHSNELQARHNSQSEKTFKEFFMHELKQWKKIIIKVLVKSLNQKKQVAERVPVVAIGSDCPTIPFSSSEEYYWLSEFFLQALTQTRSDGMPVLIKANRKRVAEQTAEYPNRDHALELIRDKQCLMFSRMGQEQFKELNGEEIGLILGVNENLS